MIKFSMSRIVGFLVVLLGLNLSACGIIIGDRSNEYMTEGAGVKLQIPEGLSQDKIKPLMPVPEITATRALDQEFKLPGPPDATAALNIEPYAIETVAGQTWLHLYTSPGKVWSLLDFFWSEYALTAQYENISTGYVHTKRLTKSAKNEVLIKALENTEYQPLVVEGMSFQAKLSQGVRRNTSELQVRVVPPSHDDKPIKEWQEESLNAKLEAALLKLIGDYVTSDELENRYSLLANNIVGESRVRLLTDKTGDEYLELQLSFERAWSEIGKALKLAEVVVADIDRGQHVYYVSYVTKEEMSRWYHLGSVDDEKSKEQNLAVYLEAGEEGHIQVRIKILNPKFDAEKQNELLNIIFEHIS